MTINQFARFCKKFVIPTNDEERSHLVCWIWIGAKKEGYGNVALNGKRHPAHRAMYEHCYGEIPDGLVVHHTCQNKPCVNPFHLELKTIAENVRASAHLQLKTHCKYGHPLEEGNLYWEDRNGRPKRYCRQCVLRNKRRSWERKLVDSLTDEDLDRLLQGEQE